MMSKEWAYKGERVSVLTVKKGPKIGEKGEIGEKKTTRKKNQEKMSKIGKVLLF